jgi:8-oxo-dGTP pyrophosphatase MutT (NUDIX family)
MNLTLPELEAHLRTALRGALPGGEAHRRMAPDPRPGWDPAREAPAGRPAAVLVLLYPGPADGLPTLVLTERPATIARHQGQVSFPGGVIDPGETPEQAALREAHEEAGVPPQVPRILGRLTPLWVPVTGFTIHPVVATADARPAFAADPREVKRVIEVTLARLMDPAILRVEPVMRGGAWVSVPHFDLEGTPLWGATAMITAELLTLLGWPDPRLC